MAQTKAQLLGPVVGDVTIDTNTLSLDAEGNKVGIGTTGATAKLHVFEPTEGDAVVQFNSGDNFPTVNRGLVIKSATGPAGYTGSKWIFDAQSSGGRLEFQTTSTPRLTILEGGNVGIGTDAPGALLHLESTAANAAKLRIGFDSPRYYDIFRGSTTNSGYLNFYGSQSTFVGYIFDGVDGEWMRIKSNGKVGIGEDTPIGQLDIKGNVSSTTQFSGFDGLRIHNANGSAFGVTADVYFTAGTTSSNRGAAIGSELVSGYGNDLYFATNGGNVSSANTLTERLRITSDGLVGINTNNPQKTLHVNSSVDNSYGIVRISGKNRGGQLEFCTDATKTAGIYSPTSSNELVFFTSSSETERLRISSDGKIGVGGTVPGALLHLRDSQNSTQGAAQLKISKGIGSGGAPASTSRANCYIHLGSSEWGSSATGQYLIGFGYTNGETGTGIPAYMGFKETSTSGYTIGDLIFGTRDNSTGTNNATERVRITSGGHMTMGVPTYSFNNAKGFDTYLGMAFNQYDGGILMTSSSGLYAGEWSFGLEASASHTHFVILDDANERLRITSDGLVGINAVPADSTQALLVQSNSTATSATHLKLRGGASGYTHSHISLNATSSDNLGNTRGLGTFLYDEPSDVEWFAGRPYSQSDYYVIARDTGVTSPAAATAQHSNAVVVVDGSGRLTTTGEQRIRYNASGGSTSKITTAFGRQGTFSTCTVTITSHAFGSMAYDIKVGGYSAASAHRAGTYYINGQIYSSYISVNSIGGSTTVTGPTYVATQKTQWTFTQTNGLIHPICSVTAAFGGSGYINHGDISIVWS